MTTALDFSAPRLNGKDEKLSKYKGKVLLIVNTASECGFTPQYKGLQALHDQFSNQGFEVLGFPCNQFGGQEPGEGDEIASFCEMNYGVNFPMFEKVDVNGNNTHPRLAPWVPRLSNGTSLNFWSEKMAKSSSVMRRKPSPKKSPKTLKSFLQHKL
jgi:glutathione peroxidase